MPYTTLPKLRAIYSQVSHLKPRLVGLDVGTQNVGVALSDPTLDFALPQVVFTRDQCTSAKSPNMLVDYVKRNKVFAMIVGFPYLEDGSESVQCEDVKLFAHQFWSHSGLDIPVILQDERFSTQIAMENYANKRKRDWNKGLKQKDKNAAAIILQDFLDLFNDKDNYIKNFKDMSFSNNRCFVCYIFNKNSKQL